jgi:multidrug efflux pump subunit AcrB
MIALVRIALSRPYTFVVLALLLLLLGPLAALRTPTDIFPDIRIPVIGVVWQYTGLPPDQMAGRITTPFERALTTRSMTSSTSSPTPITALVSSRFSSSPMLTSARRTRRSPRSRRRC